MHGVMVDNTVLSQISPLCISGFLIGHCIYKSFTWGEPKRGRGGNPGTGPRWVSCSRNGRSVEMQGQRKGQLGSSVKADEREQWNLASTRHGMITAHTCCSTSLVRSRRRKSTGGAGGAGAVVLSAEQTGGTVDERLKEEEERSTYGTRCMYYLADSTGNAWHGREVEVGLKEVNEIFWPPNSVTLIMLMNVRCALC
ncbi:hypothetical protein VTI74DRAFT_7400 [Chaetomium olivicolor]